jgi:hypothetical protein
LLRTIVNSVAVAVLLQALQAEAVSQAVPLGRRLVGTWTLSSLERRDAAGNLDPVANPRGVLIHDAAGHAIQIMTRGGRPAYASDNPTPSEAQQAFGTYSGFWGTYSTDEKSSTVTYRPDGDVNPGRVGGQETDAIELAGDRIIITIQRDATGGTYRATWERVPDLEALLPSQQRLVGFW